MRNAVKEQARGKRDGKCEQPAAHAHKHARLHRGAPHDSPHHPENAPRDINEQRLAQPYRSKRHHGTTRERIAERHACKNRDKHPERNQLALLARGDSTHVYVYKGEAREKDKQEYEHG